MCGIVGYVTCEQKETKLSNWIKKSLKKLKRRGPDFEAVYFSEGVGFGHTRLAVQDLSESGNQPMVDSSGDYVIVFNGNIYNFKTIKNRLKKSGNVFRGHSDTEVILIGYREWGHKIFYELNGFFSIAIYDNLKKKLIVARDRFGEKPLHYMCTGKTFQFSSLSNVLAGRETTYSKEGLIDYIAFGFVPAPKTIWQNVMSVLPGNYIEVFFGNNSVKMNKKCFWTPIIGNNNLSDNDIIDGLDYNLKKAAEESIISDVPVACLLSGGIDSSIVYKIMSKVSNSPINAFTVQFNNMTSEAGWAKLVVNSQKNSKHNIYICNDEDSDEIIKNTGEIYDQPFDDTSQVVSTLIFRELSKTHKVAVTGDGGDELLCGYRSFYRLNQATQVANYFNIIKHPKLKKIISKLKSNWKRIFFDLYRLSLSSNELIVDLISNGYKSYEFIDKIGIDYNPYQQVFNLIDKYQGESDITKFRYLNILFKLPYQMLQKVDRAAMYSSVEARPILLNKNFVDFALSISTDRLIQKQGKYHLKRLGEKYLPDRLIYRKKKGFGLQHSNYNSVISLEELDNLKKVYGYNFKKLIENRPENRRKRLVFGAKSLSNWTRHNSIK